MGVTIENNILKLLDDRGWTLYRLSKESGVSLTTLYSLGAKKTGPNAYSLVKLADALGVSVDALVRDSPAEGEGL